MRRAGAEQCPGAKILLIGFEIIGAIGDKGLALLQTQRHLQRARDGSGDVLLDGEDVGELAVVTLGPDMRRRYRP